LWPHLALKVESYSPEIKVDIKYSLANQLKVIILEFISIK